MLSISFSSRQPPRKPWTLDRLVQERAIALGFAIDKSTRLSYTSHLQSYLTFCKIYGFPIDPSIDTLSFYVTFMCHHIKPASVDSYLSGICNQPSSRTFARAASRRSSHAPSKAVSVCTALPLTANSPFLLNTSSSSSTLSSAPHTTIFCCAPFWCAASLRCTAGVSSLTTTTLPPQDWWKCIRRSLVSLLANNFSYTLPSHKADRFFEGNVVIISADHPDRSPVTTFHDYLLSCDRRFRLQSALWLTEHGRVPGRQ